MESDRLGAAATGTALGMRRGTPAPSLWWQEKHRDGWKVPKHQFLVTPDPIPSAAFLFVSQVTIVGNESNKIYWSFVDLIVIFLKERNKHYYILAIFSASTAL